MVEYSILISALAGLGSFFSPCILPILPAFISYLAGNTIAEVQTSNTRPSSVTSSSSSPSSPPLPRAMLTSRPDFLIKENEINRIQSSNESSRTARELQNHRLQLKQQHEQSSVTIRGTTKLNIFLNTVYFVLGFSLIFAVLGVILNSVLVNLGTDLQGTLTSIGGIVIIVFGIYLIQQHAQMQSKQDSMVNLKVPEIWSH